MKILLDTNICIYIIKQNPPQVAKQFNKYGAGEIGISAIAVAELYYGVEKSHYRAKNERALEKFLAPLIIAKFDDRAALIYGKIRANLEIKGTPIGSLDMLIAAHALSLQLTLITNNLREFNRVPNLELENWAN